MGAEPAALDEIGDREHPGPVVLDEQGDRAGLRLLRCGLRVLGARQQGDDDATGAEHAR